MDPQRAREIAASPVMANVTHNGVPIYIESILQDDVTAFVHPLNAPGNRQRVSISNLIKQ
ncbi:small acid-soluble spore protein H (minor) [Sporobacter termitidis DSM 10068]|uniref:Small acid-soluble spore protein H (Minor) n=1 Tax=Sporobacter termitidis DSM 10068 TaxID=1123282 RepID=A0A1M5VFV9_9FIRM|nr:H-type small acid-soluble spore protein [Sporobacter termitidis]SHH74081.1 small acid-soluble spore protein H (minor) [Sporobacter termitidis DSM 10068]